MSDTSPTITWKLVIDSEGSSGNTEVDLNSSTYNNVLNYGAVEAGNYSKVVCVRPYVSQVVGNVKFWWQTYKTNVQIGGSTPSTLPANGMCDNTGGKGWTMKYYVTENYIKLSYLNGDNNLLFTSTNQGTISPTNATEYKRSVWESSDASGAYYPMQPIPLAMSESGAYPTTLTAMRTRYTDLGWGIATSSGGFGTNCEYITDVAIGGVLNTGEYWCNVSQKMDNANSPAPYIYLAVKPPLEAEAGVWTGFACRLSYLWPWS